jgi:hypothetical protein
VHTVGARDYQSHPRANRVHAVGSNDDQHDTMTDELIPQMYWVLGLPCSDNANRRSNNSPSQVSCDIDHYSSLNGVE